MNAHPATIIRELRALMPVHALEPHEAQSVAERQATKLLELLGITEAPVDVGMLTELPRLDVVVKSTQQLGGLSGFTEWHKGRWLIAINRDDAPTRRRFSLGHEFKHLLDHPYIRVIYPDSHGQPSGRRAEDICDYFAACLLMPRVWVKRAWVSGIQDQTQLALRFKVSPAAMGVRLQALGLAEPRQRRHSFSGSVARYFRAGALSPAT